MTRLATLVACTLVYSSTATAAEVTDVAPAMRGDIRIDYQGSTETVNLVEGDVYFGQRVITHHTMTYAAEFVPIDGVGIKLAIPTSPSRTVSFVEPYDMFFEPVSGSGTYSFGDAPAADTSLGGKGGHGVYIGAILAPFSETFGWNTNVTWRIDVGYRTGTKTSFWTTREGKRGGGPGTGAFCLSAAFSTDKGPSSPYARIQYEGQARKNIRVVDEAGTEWASDLSVKPPSTFHVQSGVEVIAVDAPEQGSRWTIDLFSHFSYVSWGDVPSGIFLPYVLDASRSIPVRVSDHIALGVGFGLNARIAEYVGIRTSVSGVYTVPYQVEHVYPVYTSPDNYGVQWSVGLNGRIR